MNRLEMHEKTIGHYGVIPQLKKTLEEVQELLDEICSSYFDKTNTMLELADVKNMSEQLPIIIKKIIKDFDFNDKEIEHLQDLKMIRTLERISK